MSGLELCQCGHMRDEHRPGLGCDHVNRASKKFPTIARCHCARFRVDARLADSEEFIAKVLAATTRKQSIPLEATDMDDLRQVLRIALWKTSTKYDSRSHVRFGVYAYFELCNDAIDEIRSSRMFGRHGQHRLPSLSASPADADGVPADGMLLERADPHVRPDDWGGDASGLLASTSST